MLLYTTPAMLPNPNLRFMFFDVPSEKNMPIPPLIYSLNVTLRHPVPFFVFHYRSIPIIPAHLPHHCTTNDHQFCPLGFLCFKGSPTCLLPIWDSCKYLHPTYCIAATSSNMPTSRFEGSLIDGECNNACGTMPWLHNCSLPHSPPGGHTHLSIHSFYCRGLNQN